MCIHIHAAVLRRDEDDAPQALDRGPTVPPAATPSPDPARDERHPGAEEVLCHG